MKAAIVCVAEGGLKLKATAIDVETHQQTASREKSDLPWQAACR